MNHEDLKQIAELLNQQETRINLLIENEVTQKMNLMFDKLDGMDEKLDKLTSKSRVEELEDEVSLLKSVVKLHSQEIQELKKAQ